MKKNPIFFNSVITKAQKSSKELGMMIQTVINKGRFLNGPQKNQFERNFRSYLKGGYVTACGSGHDALFLALKALNVGPHDEILFSVNAYPTAFPIFMSGARAIPVDVDENGQLDLIQVKKKLSSKTKAVILVHLYGLVSDIDGLKKIIAGKKIALIEDCAQAFGSTYKGKSVGTYGDISCFSFYPTKTFGTLGDGGAIWTKNKKLHDFFVKATAYGESKRFDSEFIAGHSRIPEIQAVILNTYFKTIKQTLAIRKNRVVLYTKLLNQKKIQSFIRILESDKHSDPVLYTFTIGAKKRNQLRRFLKKKGIETDIYYPKNIHRIKAFQTLLPLGAKFPVADRLSRSIVSLPFHEYLTDAQIKYIVDMIELFYQK